MFFNGAFVLDIANFANHQGLKRERLLHSAGFDEAQLKKEGFLVDYDCISRVFKTIQKEIDLPCFGLQMGEQINLIATKYVDQLMDHSSNVQEAFEAAIAFSKLISDSMECSLELSKDYFKVNFDLNPNWALQDDYAIIQNLDMALICAKNSLQRLTQHEYFPTEVNFSYPKPKKRSMHYRLFNCHLNFNVPVSSIVFNRHLLQQPTLGKQHGLLEQLKEQANQLLASFPNESPLVSQVKKSILKNIAPTSFHIVHVANDLQMTSRTLQRKLKAEGRTFKEIQSELRLRLVVKLMNNGFKHLDEIAYFVGYSESSALIRAFKAWTGQSPKKYIETTC